MRFTSLRSLSLKSVIAILVLIPSNLVAQSASAAQSQSELGTTPNHPARVSSKVMAAQVIKHPAPTSPVGAAAGVVLQVLIDPGGKVIRSTAMSGPAELRNAASRAVERWTYKPFLLNGAPVYVETSVMVVFNP